MDNKILWFENCNYINKEIVGGKNASLGELYTLSKTINFNIADGFAITTILYDDFIYYNQLTDSIKNILDSINYDDLTDLEIKSNNLRNLIINSNINSEDCNNIILNYNLLCKKYNVELLDVAVRSSGISEDMPNASFAGQHDTYLNIKGANNIILAVKQCFASLFNTRAVSYRHTYNIELSQVKIAVSIQKMVRSDIGCAGVAFSIDPESGYDKAVVINGSFGLGEAVVNGSIKPDEFILDKRSLSLITKKIGNKNTKIIYSQSNIGTEEVKTSDFEYNNFSIQESDAKILAKYVIELEGAYTMLFNKKIGVDIEWAIDGIDKQIYIIQTRPETIHSNNNNLDLIKYILDEKSNIIVQGVSVGTKISTGKTKVLTSMQDYKLFNKGDILVTDMTTPDWEPIMKISSGIITNKGGRTCHAAIVARELGLNAIVGTGNATKIINSDEDVTLSCAEGEVGLVYNGILKFHIDKFSFTNKKLPVKLMLNVGNPENSFNSSMIPNSGVGLARLEFIISNYIKIHPLALCNYPNNLPINIKNEINNIIGNDITGKEYFVKELSRGMAKIASAFYPNDVVVRLSDFKSNEYKNLIGGHLYEPDEENPMIGWRGASRYYSKDYIDGFELECLAISHARNEMKMNNIIVMIPFCRTPDECAKVLETMKQFGLERGKDNLQVYIMCEIPSNVIEADLFSPYVDGVSIGGNDLLQLTLGIDRDGDKIAYLSDDKNISYRRMISMAIKTYKKFGVKVGFCGQQPSDSIEFCNFLINEGIDSISVTPDSALTTIYNIAK
jgi:pyruvate,water dikinase